MQTNRFSFTAGQRLAHGLLPLALALSGCVGGLSTAPTPQTIQAQRDSALPDALNGRWEATLTHVPAFYAGRSGDAPSGDGALGVKFTFAPDGRYEHTWDLAQAYSAGNCFRNAHWKEVGTVSRANLEYTLTPGRATYSVMDSCGETRFLDPAPVAPAIHRVATERGDSGRLRIGSRTGELVLVKCARCG